MVSMEIMLVRGRGCHMSSTYVQGTSIFVHLQKAGKPVVVHNGLVDLMFLYGSFYGDLSNHQGHDTGQVHI